MKNKIIITTLFMLLIVTGGIFLYIDKISTVDSTKNYMLVKLKDSDLMYDDFIPVNKGQNLTKIFNDIYDKFNLEYTNNYFNSATYKIEEYNYNSNPKWQEIEFDYETLFYSDLRITYL